MKEVIELLEQDLGAMKDAMWCLPCDGIPGSLIDAIVATDELLEKIREGLK